MPCLLTASHLNTCRICTSTPKSFKIQSKKIHLLIPNKIPPIHLGMMVIDFHGNPSQPSFISQSCIIVLHWSSWSMSLHFFSRDVHFLFSYLTSNTTYTRTIIRFCVNFLCTMVNLEPEWDILQEGNCRKLNGASKISKL